MSPENIHKHRKLGTGKGTFERHQNNTAIRVDNLFFFFCIKLFISKRPASFKTIFKKLAFFKIDKKQTIRRHGKPSRPTQYDSGMY